MKLCILITFVLALTGAGIAQEPNANPKQMIEHLHERSRDAKAAGRLEEAKELTAQAEKLQREGGRRPEKPMEKRGPMPGKGPEAERMEHIMQAIQHLHAAGLHEPAKGIEDMAHHMRREMEERMRHEQAANREREGRHGELEEMRQQMRRMAEQIEKLQAEVKKRGD